MLFISLFLKDNGFIGIVESQTNTGRLYETYSGTDKYDEQRHIKNGVSYGKKELSVFIQPIHVGICSASHSKFHDSG